MKRALGFVGSVTVLTATLGSVVTLGTFQAGCSAPLEVSPDAGTLPSATPDSSLPPPPDIGNINEPPPPRSCYIERDALGLRGTVPSSGANKCSGRQIVDFKKTCIGGTAGQCTAYINANKDCARCMLGALKGDTPEATPHPALLPIGRTIVTPNVVGCAALVLGRPDCAMKLTQHVVCTESACASCDPEEGAECNSKAIAAICKTTVDDACESTVSAGQAQWEPICRGKTFDDTYPKVAAYLCGEGGAVGDAGATDAAGD